MRMTAASWGPETKIILIKHKIPRKKYTTFYITLDMHVMLYHYVGILEGKIIETDDS